VLTKHKIMECIYANKTHLNWLQTQEKHISPEQLFRKIQSQQILLVILEKEPVGWLRFGLFWDEIPFMNLLFILPEFRKRKLGTNLVQFWESEMQQQAYKMAMTSTQADETAQHFYRKLGYIDTGSLCLETQPLEIIFRKPLI